MTSPNNSKHVKLDFSIFSEDFTQTNVKTKVSLSRNNFQSRKILKDYCKINRIQWEFRKNLVNLNKTVEKYY